MRELLKRNIKLIYWYKFFSRFKIAGPIYILFFADIADSYVKATAIFSLQYLFCVLLELPTGFLSDKLGRKWVCVVGTFSLFVAGCFYGFAVDYSMLIIGAFFMGLHTALSSGNNEALLYETVVELKIKKSYQKICGRANSLAHISLGLANLFGVGFALVSLRAVMVAAIAPSFLAFIVTLYIIEPTHIEKKEGNALKHIKNAFKYINDNRRLFFIAIGRSLNSSFNEIAFNFNSTFFQQFIPVWGLGIIRSLGHFGNSIGNRISYAVSKRLGVGNTVIFGAGITGFINVLSIIAESIASPILKILTAFTNGIKWPALSTIVQEENSNKERVTIMSIMSIIEGVFYAIGFVLIGYLADLYSPYWALFVSYIICLLSTCFYYIALKKH